MVREPSEPGLGWRKLCKQLGRKRRERVQLIPASPTLSSGSGLAGSKRVWLKEQKERTRKNSINLSNSYCKVEGSQMSVWGKRPLKFRGWSQEWGPPGRSREVGKTMAHKTENPDSTSVSSTTSHDQKPNNILTHVVPS